MFNIISFLEKNINEYVEEYRIELKEYEKDKLDKIYNEDDISKKIIKYYLECYNCGYIYDGMNKNFNYCFNCKNTFCDDCYIECKSCRCYGNKKNYHCYDCKSQCFNKTLKLIKNIYNSILKEESIEKRDIMKDEYNLDSIVRNYCKNMINVIDYDDIYDIYNILITKDYNRRNIDGIKLDNKLMSISVEEFTESSTDLSESSVNE